MGLLQIRLIVTRDDSCVFVGSATYYSRTVANLLQNKLYPYRHRFGWSGMIEMSEVFTVCSHEINDRRVINGIAIWHIAIFPLCRINAVSLARGLYLFSSPRKSNKTFMKRRHMFSDFFDSISLWIGGDKTGVILSASSPSISSAAVIFCIATGQTSGQ